MTVEELIKKYEESKKLKKDYDFSKHIKLHYMLYTEKLSLVKNILEATSYIDVENKRGYRRDTPNMIFVFTMKLIEKYTDIDIKPENVVSDYDLLMETGIMHLLTAAVPEDEVKIIQGMLDMARDDLEYNTRSLVSFLESKTDALRIAMDSVNAVLERPEVKAKIAEFTKKS